MKEMILIFPNKGIHKQGNTEFYSHVLFVFDGKLLIPRRIVNITTGVKLLSDPFNSI